MQLPSFNRSSHDYHAPDVYSESQALTDRKDDYQSAQDENRPETYRDKYRMVFLLVKFYRTVFPYLSAATLAGLAFFLTLGFDVFINPPEAKVLALGVVGMVGFALLIAINEAVKSRTLKAWFKALALRRKPEPGTPVLAISTTVLSIIGSAVGVFLVTYQFSNKAPEIQNQAEASQRAARLSFSADSARIVGSYQPLIESKRQAIEQYDPGRFRTLRDKLNNEAIRLTEKMNEELAETRQRVDSQQTQITAGMETDLVDNQSSSQEKSWFAFGVLVALELLNLFAHRYERGYLAKVEKEGIEFGALEASAEKTAYEIQLSRLSTYIQQVGQANGLHVPGLPTPAGIPRPSSQDERPKVGFMLPWESRTGGSTPMQRSPLTESGNGSEMGFKRGLKGDLNGGTQEADFSSLDPQAAAEIAGYLDKYRHVVKAVIAGRTNREVSETCSVSVSTVHNVKRCMRVVKLLPERVA